MVATLCQILSSYCVPDTASFCFSRGRKFFFPCSLADVVIKLTWDRLANIIYYIAVTAQWVSHVQPFATPWTAAHQASLFFTISQSLLKLMSIESVMPSNHLILCCPLLLLPSVFHSIGVFSNESVLHIRWPSIGALASASVLSMNIQDWFPLRLTGLTSLLSTILSRIFSSTTIEKHPFFSVQPSLWYNSHINTWLLKKTKAFIYDLFQQGYISTFEYTVWACHRFSSN